MEMPYLPQANCIGTDTEAFFPKAARTIENDTAKRVCERCVEKEPCLEWALRHELHGTWGGKTAGERAKMRTKLGIPFRAPEIAVLQGLVSDAKPE